MKGTSNEIKLKFVPVIEREKRIYQNGKQFKTKSNKRLWTWASHLPLGIVNIIFKPYFYFFCFITIGIEAKHNFLHNLSFKIIFTI